MSIRQGGCETDDALSLAQDLSELLYQLLSCLAALFVQTLCSLGLLLGLTNLSKLGRSPSQNLLCFVV